MDESDPTNWKPRRPDLGGTPAPGPERYQSTILQTHGQAIAETMTRRFYETWPELDAKYGEKGRKHTFEDQFWHLSTLDVAWQSHEPKVFVDYVQWLRNFLAARGMGDDISAANFAFLVEALRSTSIEASLEPEREELLAIVTTALELFPSELRQAPPPGQRLSMQPVNR